MAREDKAKFSVELKNVQKIVDNLARQIKQIKNLNTGQSKIPDPTLYSNTTKKSTAGENKTLPILPGFNLIRSNSQPMVKGKISKGINYDPGSLSIFTKAKIKDL